MPQLKVTPDTLLEFNPTQNPNDWEVTFNAQTMEIQVTSKAQKIYDDQNTAKRSKRNKKPNKLLFDDYVDKYDYLDNEEQSEKKNKRKNVFNSEFPK
jgi:hypothetical protein